MFTFVSFDEIAFNLALPIVAILICACILSFKSKRENSNSFLAVVLGIILGICSTLIQEGVVTLKNKSEFRKSAFVFLKQDTENIYATFWTYRSLNLQLRDLMTPPEFYLNNWNILKQNDQFISLVGIKPFDNIYKLFWQFEEINTFLDRYEKDLDKSGLGKGSLIWAKHLFKNAADKRLDKELLEQFMSREEVDKYEKDFDASHKSHMFTSDTKITP